MEQERNIHVIVEVTKTDHRKLSFREDRVTGRQLKEAAGLPPDTKLAVQCEGELDRIVNDEMLDIRDGERFIVIHGEVNIHVVVEVSDADHRRVDFHDHRATGRQIKEAADVSLDDTLQTRRDGKPEVIRNDETITIVEGEHFVVVARLIAVSVHYMAASKPFKTEVPPATTVGKIKAEAMKAFGLVEDAAKVYRLFHEKEEIADLNRTVGEFAGHAKAVSFKLEEILVQGG